LKLVLEHREVANWQKLSDRLLADKEILAGVRLKFRDIDREIEGRLIRPRRWTHSWENSPPRRRRTASMSLKVLF
jgi:hypothetical protein